MSSQMQLNFDHQALANFCRSQGIRGLSLFGSAVRADYRPGESDFDVLAEFDNGPLRGVGLAFLLWARIGKNSRMQSGLLH